MGFDECISYGMLVVSSVDVQRRDLIAAIQHAQRVLRILGVEDQIEGLVYCDYSLPNFACKPEPEFFHNVSMLCEYAALLPLCSLPTVSRL